MLVLALALATPLGLAVYRILGENLYSPRNLIASLRAVCLLLGYLISRSSMPVVVAATLLLAGGTAQGTVEALSAGQRRTPWNDAAELIDERARAGTLQLDLVAGASGSRALARSLSIYLDRPARLSRGDAQWSRAARGTHMLVAADLPPGSSIEPRPPPQVARRYRLVGRQAFPGFNEVVVFSYRREP